MPWCTASASTLNIKELTVSMTSSGLQKKDRGKTSSPAEEIVAVSESGDAFPFSINTSRTMAFPDMPKRFFVLSDASGIGKSAILGQCDRCTNRGTGQNLL